MGQQHAEPFLRVGEAQHVAQREVAQRRSLRRGQVQVVEPVEGPARRFRQVVAREAEARHVRARRQAPGQRVVQHPGGHVAAREERARRHDAARGDVVDDHGTRARRGEGERQQA
jgi:hypothetical protein